MKLFSLSLASLVLLSSTWVVPAHADCQIDAYGNMACLFNHSGSNNEKISVNRINQTIPNSGDSSLQVPPDPVYRQSSTGGQVVLYQDENFQGVSVEISNRGVEDLRLSSTIINDHPSSLVINSGMWQVCEDVNYQGICRVLGPGRYPNLGIQTLGVGMANGNILSVRPAVIRQF